MPASQPGAPSGAHDSCSASCVVGSSGDIQWPPERLHYRAMLPTLKILIVPMPPQPTYTYTSQNAAVYCVTLASSVQNAALPSHDLDLVHEGSSTELCFSGGALSTMSDAFTRTIQLHSSPML